MYLALDLFLSTGTSSAAQWKSFFLFIDAYGNPFEKRRLLDGTRCKSIAQWLSKVSYRAGASPITVKITSYRNQEYTIQTLNALTIQSSSTLVQLGVWFCVYFSMSLVFFSPTLVSLPAHSLSGKEGETLLSQCSCWFGVTLSVIFFSLGLQVN